MLRQQMPRKLYRIPAVEVFQFSAAKALCVKMVAAVATFSHILIARFRGLLIAEFAHDVAGAQLGQVAVNTALPRRGSVYGNSNFLRREMLVGVAGEKFQQAFPARRFIRFHLFLAPSHANLRNILISQRIL